MHAGRPNGMRVLLWLALVVVVLVFILALFGVK